MLWWTSTWSLVKTCSPLSQLYRTLSFSATHGEGREGEGRGGERRGGEGILILSRLFSSTLQLVLVVNCANIKTWELLESGRWEWEVGVGGGSGRWELEVGVGGGSGRWEWGVGVGGGSGRWEWEVGVGGRSGRLEWEVGVGGGSQCSF